MVQIAASSFEGLFIQALKVEGQVVEKLKQVGFDAKRMEPAYGVDVWRKALQVASLEYYPKLSPSAAEFQLGSRMVEGYFGTIVGKMIQAAIPYLSADTLCLRLPRFFASGIVGEVKKPEVVKVADKHYTVKLFGDQGVPWFTAGAIDSVLRQTKVKPTCTVADVKADNFTIDITWL